MRRAPTLPPGAARVRAAELARDALDLGGGVGVRGHRHPPTRPRMHSSARTDLCLSVSCQWLRRLPRNSTSHAVRLRPLARHALAVDLWSRVRWVWWVP